MKTPLNQTLRVLALLTAIAWVAPSFAAQRVLAQSPAGAAREPAPNVIVSVDNSGSMGTTGIATLKAALTRTFSVTNLEDGRVRLAWQSMHGCNAIPSNNGGCGNLNYMRPLQGTHRTNFFNWVNSLTHGGGTPAHRMFLNAGQYLQSPLGINSPWAADPSVTEQPYLSCRKSFHVFMTDGMWNSSVQFVTDHIDADNIVAPAGNANADGTTRTFPDLTPYGPFTSQTNLYSDPFGQGGQAAVPSFNFFYGGYWYASPNFPAGGASTLADLAFHFWSTDLQTNLTNDVRKAPKGYDNLPASENFGTAANPAILNRYWNPRYNPATWQNMVNYTIGFNAAANWTTSPTWGGDTYSNIAGLITGSQTWPSPFCNNNRQNPGSGNLRCLSLPGYFYGDGAAADARRMDLWHAALNSRGRFVPAPNDQALVDAFQVIMGDILNQTANPLVSIATSSSRLRTDGKVFVAGFASENWSGDLGAYTITAGTNAVAATPTWSAAAQLDTSTFVVNDRLVLTHNGTAGTSFVWGSLTTAQQALIQGSDSSTVGQNRVNYLRGDRSQESQNGGTLRRRDSRLGDIVNSNIWLLGRPSRMAFEHPGHSTFRTAQAGRTPTLFVGANDGMLHGFDAATGKERMAYVPLGVYNKLRDYTQTTYAHQYYVDGHPFSGDADLSYVSGTSTTPDWRTVLVSGLGAGARGYFALDVTTGTYSTSSVLFDKSFSASTTLTSSELDDIGHIFATPVVDPVSGNRSEQIVKLNNGRWAVIMGNGVNSHNERPVLLIQYLDGGKELLRIIAHSTTGQSNGLSAPRPIDVNGNGTADIVYAGDLLGNVWKFNLTSTNAANWGVSNYSGGTTLCKNATTCNPLFVAVDGSGNRQPITAAPLWMAHPQGGIQVLVGTGLNVTASDRSNTSTQSIYSVWDKGRYSSASGLVTVVDQGNLTATDTRSMLVTQTVLTAVTTTVGGTNTSTIATDFYNTSQNSVTYSWVVSTAKRGWFMDLPAQRERVLAHPQIFEGQKVIVSSNVPKLGATGETCDFDVVTEDNWINVLNMITGKPSTSQVFTSTDATLNANLKFATRTRFGSGEYITINRNDGGADLISLKNDDPNCPQGQLCTERQRLTTGTVPGARADWRQVR